MAHKRRRLVKVVLTLSLRPGVKKAEAIKEVRSRVNDLCAYHTIIGGQYAEDSDVRVRAAK